MIAAPIPIDEEARIAALDSYHILDTMPEQVFDDITYLASLICRTPIALISLVDRERQWFKSRIGLEAAETHRDLAFCAHAILEPEVVLVVKDAELDARFADNDLVHDGTVRFYAGAPLQTGEGNALGTICVIDQRPRELDNYQQTALQALSRQVMGQLELRKALHDLERYQSRLESYQIQLETSNQELAALGRRDGLTSLANRQAFDERLDDEMHRARKSGRPLCLLMVDVDYFKQYNDTFGHSAGDDVLIEIARHLSDIGRADDFVARYGGEEFAVILPETPVEGAAVVAERIRRRVANHSWEHREVTISIGLDQMKNDDLTPRELISRADAALYEAKASGRNCVVESVAR